MYVLLLALAAAVVLKFFPPKKPNPFFGYQLGSAQKSPEHWKLANKHAANYLIVLNLITLAVVASGEYYDADTSITAIIFYIIGSIAIYKMIEEKLEPLGKE